METQKRDVGKSYYTGTSKSYVKQRCLIETSNGDVKESFKLFQKELKTDMSCQTEISKREVKEIEKPVIPKQTSKT